MKAAILTAGFLLGAASYVSAQTNVTVTPSYEMIQADGSPVDLVKVQACQASVAMRPHDGEFGSRTLAKDERVPTVDFANIYRRAAGFLTCLDKLGYAFRVRAVLPK